MRHAWLYLLAATTRALAQSAEPVPEPTAPPPDPAPAPAPPSDHTPEVPAVSLEETPETQKLELKPGGYLQVDARRPMTDDEAHEITIRRLRFKLDGSASKLFKFRTLIDFAGSKLVVEDAWIEGVIRPELALRAGKDKSQFGIERLQSAAQLVFLERAYPTQLAPNRDIGIWARGDIAGGLVHYAAGVVDGVADNAVIEGDSDDEFEYNIHVLISPFAGHAELGDLAVGAATTFGRTTGNATTTGVSPIKSAGQQTIVSYVSNAMDASLTAMATGYRTRYTAHAYYYRGPAGVLAEYVRDKEPVLLTGSTTFTENQAWQLAGSIAVTPGDKVTYKSVKPRKPLDPQQGTWGAVELAARYSELRIDPDNFEAKVMKPDKAVERAREYAFGANWYFNEYLKLQLNYSFTSFSGATPATDRASEHLIATRLQVAI